MNLVCPPPELFMLPLSNRVRANGSVFRGIALVLSWTGNLNTILYTKSSATYNHGRNHPYAGHPLETRAYINGGVCLSAGP
jgi:hypothetical protein